MLSYKSFVDVLFILLLSTMVMLTQSVQLGAIDTVIARLGSGGISPISADEIQVVVIGEEELQLAGRTWARIDELVQEVRPEDPVLLVTADGDVRHHRVLSVWSALVERGLDVKLGARPARPDREGKG